MTSIIKHAPRFSEQEAVGIAHNDFGLDVCARQLPSERDQNFHLTCLTGEQYVLKVANATEGLEVLEFQNQVMMHIARNKYRLDRDIAAAPQICENITGRQIMSLFQKISIEENVTVVMVTHDLIVEEYASLIYHLGDGQVSEMLEHPENKVIAAVE